MQPTKPLAVLRQRGRKVDEAILLKSLFQSSYYHFLFEVIPKLEIIERAGVASDIPVIVTKDLASRNFLIEAKEMGLFGDRPIIIQNEDEVISAGRLYIARPDFYTARQLSYPLRRLGYQSCPRRRDRIYISRSIQAPNGRYIINEHDLIARLRPLGFTAIDPGTLPLSAQIACFSRASIVVGPHGAGLTNILFRYGAPMALVEMINDTKKWNNLYFQIATHCGYFYRATLNRAEPGHQKTAAAHADIDAVMAAVEESIAWETSVYGESS
jgi:capsular polysaccharide biosynthesis protein